MYDFIIDSIFLQKEHMRIYKSRETQLKTNIQFLIQSPYYNSLCNKNMKTSNIIKTSIRPLRNSTSSDPMTNKLRRNKRNRSQV